MRSAAMSAMPPLLGDERKCWGPRQTDAIGPFADSVIWTKDLGGLRVGELPNVETGLNFMVGGSSMSLAWLAGGGCGLAPVGDRTELKSRKGFNGVTSGGDNNAAARTREG
jgi:hypothetical protein